MSTSINDFSIECQTLHSRRPLWEVPALAPLKRSPCLSLDEEARQFLVLSAPHLALAGVDGPVEQLEHAGDKNALGDFGYVVEDHVHVTLRALFGSRYQRLRRLKERSRADGIVWYEQGFIVVEAKARRTAPRRRYQGRTDEGYAEELEKRDLAKAIGQIDITIDDVMAGAIPLQGAAAPRIAGGLIVNSEELPLSIIAESVLGALLPPTAVRRGIRRLRPQIVSLAELEQLDRWRGETLLDILERKVRDDNTAVESLTGFMMLRGVRPAPSSLQTSQCRELATLWRRWFPEK